MYETQQHFFQGLYSGGGNTGATYWCPNVTQPNYGRDGNVRYSMASGYQRYVPRNDNQSTNFGGYWSTGGR